MSSSRAASVPRAKQPSRTSPGAWKHLIRIIGRIRQSWPQVRIVLRGDSGFCREHLMRCCEANGVDYLFGLAKNRRLLALLQPSAEQAAGTFTLTKQPARVFADFRYPTRESWSRERRVVGKAEHVAQGPNPRLVVTSLTPEEFAAVPRYEQEYGGRGDRENRIKEQPLMWFACRVRCATMRANPIRLCLATVAYVVLRALRQFGLAETELAQAQGDTLRVKLRKIGVVVRVTVRKVWVALSEAYPYRVLVVGVAERLARLSVPRSPAVVGSG